MNSTQRRYAIERVSEVYQVKRRKIEETAKKEHPGMTRKSLLTEIKAGRIKVAHPDRELIHYDDIKDVFQMPKGWEGEEAKESATTKQRKAALYQEFYKIKDELMLGDAQEAVALIKAFTAKEF